MAEEKSSPSYLTEQDLAKELLTHLPTAEVGIPPEVFVDSRLTAEAKLLFGIIFSLRLWGQADLATEEYLFNLASAIGGEKALCKSLKLLIDLGLLSLCGGEAAAEYRAEVRERGYPTPSTKPFYWPNQTVGLVERGPDEIEALGYEPLSEEGTNR